VHGGAAVGTTSGPHARIAYACNEPDASLKSEAFLRPCRQVLDHENCKAGASLDSEASCGSATPNASRVGATVRRHWEQTVVLGNELSPGGMGGPLRERAADRRFAGLGGFTRPRYIPTTRHPRAERRQAAGVGVPAGLAMSVTRTFSWSTEHRG